jgi:putative ABC transport system permease protein
MSVFETVRVALESIFANLLRSTLTMLGIIIGVSAVITMVALGTGAQKAIDEQIDSLGARLLSVYPGQSFRRGVASQNRVSLTVDDYEALAVDTPYLSAIVPELRGNRQVKVGNRNLYQSITGTTPVYPDVNGRTIGHGRWFTEGEVSSRRRVAVLGYAIPDALETKPELLIGRTINISRIPFEIIGVVDEVGSSMSWMSYDDMIFIPLSTAQLRLFGSDRLGSLSAQVAEGVSLEMGMIDLERVLRREHKIRPGADNDFQIMNRRQFLDMQQASTEVFAGLLASIAGVSLLVGGIGIMNIMLVSVTERTREIGVRKALGATRFNILMQFVIEALTIGVIGGLMGIALGGGGAWALSTFLGWNVYIAPEAVLLAVLFSIGVGLIFGIWPARRAAQLDPIEALRHD